ncbi:cation:proton antiporter [Tessaracoccus sp. OS52]|uniref:cation:proton antiporter n=1 Tax=Tessaracoccus sp. OS52 TaxID=2886691 RepID=UPI001D0F6798|nr:cation:proton antiporter [Tessaracoccus sp. OS52]MCC2592765.1 cation:proton antiporter [Tessaracoccus sp. OS52]
MTADAVYLVAGIALFIAVVAPVLVRSVALSAPLILLVLGLLIGLFPMPEGWSLDPVGGRKVIEHVTEVAVLVALMGVGLALDRPLNRSTWRSWSPTWRLLIVAMPLTIAAVFLLGWSALGLAAPVALLLGACLAPTDPVLAGDVQVDGPKTAGSPEEAEPEERDEVRFSLTSEAGLNDGLAFPFVYAAVYLASRGPVAQWGGAWIAWDLLGKIAVGVLVGALVGWGLGRFSFRAADHRLRLAERGEPLLAVAALVLSYGATEVVGGYGFLGVFACGVALRSVERHHDHHRAMHQVIGYLERLLILVILLFLGMALTRTLLAGLDWRAGVIAVVLVFVIRPAAAWVSLTVAARDQTLPGGLTPAERAVTAFFGVRGVGSLYYLAYAGGLATLPDESWLWSTVAFTILLSVLVHGMASTPVLRRLSQRSPS